MQAWLIAALVVSWVLLAVLVGLLVVLLQQHGRLIVQQDELLARLAQVPARRPGEDDGSGSTETEQPLGLAI